MSKHIQNHRRTRRVRGPILGFARRTLWSGELLERRELFAADYGLLSSSHHNAMFPADVNSDERLTPADALVGINSLNRVGMQDFSNPTASEGESGTAMRLDVNGDGAHTPNDILRTINLLNAEGEDGVVINVRARIYARPANYPFFDNDNDPATPPQRVTATQEISTVGIGQDFVVKLFVEDVRSQSARQGVYGGYYDINFSNPDLASLVTTLPFVTHPQSTTGLSTPFLHQTVNYGQAARPAATQTGLIDTNADGKLDQVDVIGSFTGSFNAIGPGEFVLVEFAMNATSDGTFTITPEATTDPQDPNDAGESPAFDTGLFGSDEPVCPASRACMGQMAFFSDSITIVRDITAVPDQATTAEDSAVEIPVLANDVVAVPAGGLPRLQSFTQPTNATVTRNTKGTAAETDDTLTVTPNANVNGQVTFSYTINNGQGATSTATVTVTVQPVNDAPVNSVPASLRLNEDSTAALAGVSVADIDADAGTGLLVNLTVQNGTLNVTPNGATVTGSGTAAVQLTGSVAQINAALGTISYRPNANYAGTDTFSIRTRDQGNTGGTTANPGASNPLEDNDSVTITVDPVNDAPVNTVPGAQSVFNTDVKVFENRILQTSDVDATTVEVQLSVTQGTLTLGSITGLTVVGNGTATVRATGNLTNINNGLNNLVYNPTDTFVGTDTLTITTNDLGGTGAGGAITDVDTVSITVTPPTQPFAAADNYSVNEDSSNTQLMILANDLAPLGTPVNTLMLTAVNGQGVGVGQQLTTVNGGTITVETTSVQYRPAANFAGTDSFFYTIESTPNAGDGPSTATVSILVRAINDGPVNTVPAGPLAVNEDSSLAFTGSTAVSVSDIDAGTSPIRVTVSVTAGTVAVANGATVTNNNTNQVRIDGTVAQVNTALAGLVFTPAANFNGPVTLTVLTTDNGNTGGTVADPSAPTPLTDSDSVVISVAAINDAPTITAPANQIAITDFDNTFSTATNNAIQIADIDAGSGNVQVALSIGTGTLNVTNTANLSSITGNGTGSVTLQGTVAQLNAALGAGVVYRVSQSGMQTLNAQVNDLGNSGGTVGNPGANNPLTASTSVAVEVLDFQPSFLGGYVYVDGDLDGQKDTDELTVENVQVQLTGTTFRNVPVSLTASTNRMGYYQFSDLQPGTYTLRQVQPANLTDGRDSFQAPFVTTQNDTGTISIPVAGGVNLRNNNFGEGTLTTEFLDIVDLLASSHQRVGIILSSSPTSTWAGYLGPASGWSGYSNPRVNLAAGTLTVTNSNGQDRVVNLMQADPQFPGMTFMDRVRVRERSGFQTIRIQGSAADFGLPVMGASGEAEGEGSPLAMMSAGGNAAQFVQAVDQIMTEFA
jgi:hypothetical protein